MEPHEKLRSLLWALIWYLLPLSYIIVDRFLPFDQAINIYPHVLIQIFIACGLLYWGINNTTERAVRKIWLWMQAYATVAIFHMAIGGIKVFTLWIDIALHILLPILWIFTLYKTIIAGSDINPVSVQAKVNRNNVVS